jgi:hypothetical protein
VFHSRPDEIQREYGVLYLGIDMLLVIGGFITLIKVKTLLALSLHPVAWEIGQQCCYFIPQITNYSIVWEALPTQASLMDSRTKKVREGDSNSDEIPSILSPTFIYYISLKGDRFGVSLRHHYPVQ